MGVQRGSTPEHTFTTDIDLTLAEVVLITYSQQGRIILEKTRADIEVYSDKVLVHLTQEETLRFDERYEVEMQIRARYPNNSAPVSCVMHTTAGKVLNEEVI